MVWFLLDYSGVADWALWVFDWFIRWLLLKVFHLFLTMAGLSQVWSVHSVSFGGVLSSLGSFRNLG